MSEQKMQVFAVVRLDQTSQNEISTADFGNLEQRITIKEIVSTQGQAEEEVGRLNTLNAGKGAFYFWQATRYYPRGR